jgi:choline kinase
MGWDKPKCLLEFHSLTLLDNILLALCECGVRDVTIVLGYERQQVEQRLAAHDVRFNVVYNPDYAETNTIHSLYLARDFLRETFFYFNADVLFDRRILAGLLHSPGSTLAVDARRCGEEEVKVVVDSGRRITQIGKKLDPSACRGEFIGVGKFDASCGDGLVRSLCRYNEQLNERNLFFESAVNDILGEHSFTAMDIEPMRAVEIDSPEDYHAACRLVAEGEIAC